MARTKTASTEPRKAYFLKVKVTFTTPLLATNPGNPEIYSDFIAKEASDETRKEELARLGVTQVDEKGMTVFLRDPDDPMVPVIKGYTWLGFLKSRAKALAKIPGSAVNGMSAYIKEINDLVEVTPRFQKLILPDEEKIKVMSEKELVSAAERILDGINSDAVDALQRPLRAETMQGDRVALAKSETAPAGTSVILTFRCERKEGMNIVKECLDYGASHGTGQWRNAGFGRFTWEKLDSWAEEIKSTPLTDEDFPVREAGATTEEE